MTNLIGQSLGRYHILEQLGEGGMATVYKAYDTRLETDVAVKVIRTDNLAPSIVERALKRFEREAKALAKLTHANIVKVTDYGEYEGKPYLVMPYLPGGTLKARLQGKPMPWREAVHWLLPIARALSYAHKQGMIHRDIKPSNILITEAGDPLLTDFGIAKIIDEEATVDLTGTSATVGTPEYMAPEQVTSKTVDARADIYALGVVFYEMVTGRKPFQADTPMAVLFKQASEPLPRTGQFVRDVPESVEKVLIKALAKKPEDRYQSMDEFVNAMMQLGERSQVDAATMQPNHPTTPETSSTKSPLGTQPSWRSGFPIKGWMWGAVGACAVLGFICLIATVVLIFKLIPGGIVIPVAASTPRATRTPKPTNTPEATSTPEWMLIEVPSSNFAVAIPASWIQVDLDPATLEQSIQGIKDENPKFGSIVESLSTSLVDSGAVFFGIDSQSGNAFPANISVLKMDLGVEVPVKDVTDAMAAQMEAGGTAASKVDVEVVDTIEGEAGVMRFTMKITNDGVENEVHTVQMLYVNGSTMYYAMMMCATDQADQYDGIFEDMIYSFRIQ